MIEQAVANVMAYSLLGLMVCIALLITLAAYWLTR